MTLNTYARSYGTRGKHFNSLFILIPREGCQWVGVNLAAKGTFFNEIGTLFNGIKVHVFELCRHLFELCRHLFEFWRQLVEVWRQIFEFWPKF